jgi:murein DD-endopeptidase MepM/ murein hydrolase activator NlpD
MILVSRGQEVRRNEVIALSGSTGQSTAAHLHFEILYEGTPVDPLSMVEQPG